MGKLLRGMKVNAEGQLVEDDRNGRSVLVSIVVPSDGFGDGISFLKNGQEVPKDPSGAFELLQTAYWKLIAIGAGSAVSALFNHHLSKYKMEKKAEKGKKYGLPSKVWTYLVSAGVGLAVSRWVEATILPEDDPIVIEPTTAMDVEYEKMIKSVWEKDKSKDYMDILQEASIEFEQVWASRKANELADVIDYERFISGNDSENSK